MLLLQMLDKVCSASRLRDASRSARGRAAAYEPFQKKQDGAFEVLFEP